MRFRRAAYAASAKPSLELSFAITKIRHLTIPNRMKANFFRRLSILFRPHQKHTEINVFMVEPPGTAPGSSPLMTSAFIIIAGKPALYM